MTRTRTRINRLRVQLNSRSLRAEPYASEDLLQGLLEKHSVVLAGDQLTPNSDARRFLLARPEAGVPDTRGGGHRWSIDHLLVDQDGIPTLVEVKRSTDTRSGWGELLEVEGCVVKGHRLTRASSDGA